MEFRNILFFLTFLFTITLGNPVEAHPSADIDLATSTSSAPSTVSHCIVNGKYCKNKNKDCCSGFCRCNVKNPLECTCADLRPTVLASREDIDAPQECRADLSHCKHDSDCCSNKCYGIRLGGLLCWSPPSKTADTDLAVSTDKLTLNEEPVRKIDDAICKANDEDCSGRQDVKCCSGYCWCSPLNPNGSTCAVSPLSDAVANVSDAIEEVADKREDNFDASQKPDDVADNQDGPLTGGVPHGLPCKIINSKCEDNQDCCSSDCKSGRCQKKSLDDRGDVDGVPPIPPCQKNDRKCFMDNQCCSHYCEAGICKKKKTLEARVANLKRGEGQFDKMDDQASSKLADGPVPPPPCKLAGVRCRDDRECCYGRCNDNKKCWKPTDQLS